MGLLSWLGGGSRKGPGAEPGEPAPAGGRGGEAWRELPPVQRTAGDLGLVTDPGGFRASLGTWQDVSFSRPLGHLVSSEAPAGMLYDVASASPEPPPAAGPQAAEPGTRTWDAPRSGGTAAHPAVALQRVLDGGPLTSAAAPREEAGEPAGPVALRPLTPPDAGPEPDAPSSVRELPAPPLLPPPGAEPPAPPAVQRAARPEAGPAAPPLPPPATPPVQRTTEQPAVRPHQHLGIGEPLPGLPPTARGPAARSTPASVTPEPAAPEPAAPQPPPAQPYPAAADAPSPAAPPDSPPEGPLLGDDPLLPRAPAPDAAEAPDAREAAEVPEAPGNPLALVGVQRLPAELPHPAPPPAPGPERLAGLVGERPVPLFARTDSPGTTTPAPDPEQPVVARWATASPAEPVRRSAPRPAVPATRYVQRSSAAAPGGTNRPDPPSPSHPAPRRPAAGRPWADAGAVAIAAGVAQRTADGSVVFAPPPPTAAVQRAPEPATAEPEFAPSTGSDDSGPADSVPEPGGPAATTTSRPAAPAGKPDTEDGAAPHVDDALVRALFPRLSRLLKDELRRDRERAGFLINTRH